MVKAPKIPRPCALLLIGTISAADVAAEVKKNAKPIPCNILNRYISLLKSLKAINNREDISINSAPNNINGFLP
jgi:hypothetical protein